MPPRPNDAKLQELIVFIASRSEDDPRFGSTKLNKLLFFADFYAFVKLGNAITHHEYMRLPQGPAPRKMKLILDDMIAAGDMAIQERDHYGKTQKVPIALREPDLTGFSSSEVVIVTDVLKALKSKNAKGISTLSHSFPGWKLAKDRETIPYDVALVDFKKPRQRDINKALGMRSEIASLRRESRERNAGE